MKSWKLFLFAFSSLTVLHSACTKTGNSFPPPPPDPCSIVAVGASGSATNPSSAGASDGMITATATGGSGFMYSLNGGTFQHSGRFNGLMAGNYSIVARNSDGCSATVSFLLINPAVQCSGVNITANITATLNIPCEPNTASINISASGGVPPYTYSLGNNLFQPQPVFTNVANGSYTITIKDANGCTGSASTTVNSQPGGPLFAEVRSVVQYYCISCHNSTTAAGAVNYSLICNIVSGKERIKARAVDANPSAMPQGGLIPQSERQKILSWINAGGRYSD